jgi:hypothetical protein
MNVYYHGGLPDGSLATDALDLFVSDPGGNEVIEMDAGGGRLVRVIDGPQYDFGTQSALTTIGPEPFVANRTGQTDGSVTDIGARTGGLVQIFSGKQLGPPSRSPSPPWAHKYG